MKKIIKIKNKMEHFKVIKKNKSEVAFIIKDNEWYVYDAGYKEIFYNLDPIKVPNYVNPEESYTNYKIEDKKNYLLQLFKSIDWNNCEYIIHTDKDPFYSDISVYLFAEIVYKQYTIYKQREETINLILKN